MYVIIPFTPAGACHAAGSEALPAARIGLFRRVLTGRVPSVALQLPPEFLLEFLGAVREKLLGRTKSGLARLRRL